MRAEIDFTTADIKVAVLTSAYTFSYAHEYKSSLSGILATAPLLNVVFPLGVFNADDTLVVAPGGPIAQAVIYVDTGSAATSPLFVFFDTGLNFVFTPSGDMVIVWPKNVEIGIFPMGGKRV